VLGALHEASPAYKDDDGAHSRRLGAGRHSLPSNGSSDSLKNIMSIEVPSSPSAPALLPSAPIQCASGVDLELWCLLVFAHVLVVFAHVLVFGSPVRVVQVVLFALTCLMQCLLSPVRSCPRRL
jgi:hypothetical protein